MKPIIVNKKEQTPEHVSYMLRKSAPYEIRQQFIQELPNAATYTSWFHLRYQFAKWERLRRKLMGNLLDSNGHVHTMYSMPVKNRKKLRQLSRAEWADLNPGQPLYSMGGLPIRFVKKTPNYCLCSRPSRRTGTPYAKVYTLI